MYTKFLPPSPWGFMSLLPSRYDLKEMRSRAWREGLLHAEEKPQLVIFLFFILVSFFPFASRGFWRRRTS